MMVYVNEWTHLNLWWRCLVNGLSPRDYSYGYDSRLGTSILGETCCQGKRWLGNEVTWLNRQQIALFDRWPFHVAWL